MYASSRKLPGSARWNGTMVDEGQTIWRCPHWHRSQVKAWLCAYKDYRRRVREIDKQDFPL